MHLQNPSDTGIKVLYITVYRQFHGARIISNERYLLQNLQNISSGVQCYQFNLKSDALYQYRQTVSQCCKFPSSTRCNSGHCTGWARARRGSRTSRAGSRTMRWRCNVFSLLFTRRVQVCWNVGNVRSAGLIDPILKRWDDSVDACTAAASPLGWPQFKLETRNYERWSNFLWILMLLAGPAPSIKRDWMHSLTFLASIDTS